MRRLHGQKDSHLRFVTEKHGEITPESRGDVILLSRKTGSLMWHPPIETSFPRSR